jgi:hypothetical protein
MGMVPNGRNRSLRATGRRLPSRPAGGRFSSSPSIGILRDSLSIKRFPVIGKLSKAGSSDGVEIRLYSLDRPLRLLRHARGLPQLSFPRFAIFSESPKAT